MWSSDSRNLHSGTRKTMVINGLMQNRLPIDPWEMWQYRVVLKVAFSDWFNTLRQWQNGRYFPDIFKCICLNGNVGILIKISMKFVLKGPINNFPALVQIMAWRRPKDKPLFEPMMVSLPTHIWVARPQWVNILRQWQSGRDIPDNIFKCICLNGNVEFWLKFHWSLYFRVQLTIFQYCFR